MSTARSHPPAVVQRQLELDRAMFLPLLQGFSERQAQLFLMLASLVSKHQPETLQRLADDDIAQAAEALAATLETAGRGILYEHRPASSAAARLMSELKAMIDEVVKNAGSALERDAAIALRRLEQAAKAATGTTSSAQSVLQELFARVLAPPSGVDKQASAAAPASSIILPP